MTKPVLLFDLGGVIVPWVGIEALARNYGLSRDAVIARLAASEVFQAYEVGACDNETFLEEMIKLFAMDMPRADLAKTWNSWVLPPFPNVLETLQKLKARFVVACLSNTNDLHWRHLNTLFKTDDILDFDFASHQIQAAKPNKESYLIPLDIMGVAPSDVTFFDDTLINVEAAQNLGIAAHHVDRSVGVLPTLKKLGLT